MIVDFTITIGNIITLAVMIVGAVSAWFLLRGDVAANKTGLVDMRVKYDTALADIRAKHEALVEAHSVLSKRVEEIRARGAHELAEYKLLVAREYATSAAIKEVEERVVEAINRLGDRFDNYFDRQTGARRRGGAAGHD